MACGGTAVSRPSIELVCPCGPLHRFVDGVYTSPGDGQLACARCAFPGSIRIDLRQTPKTGVVCGCVVRSAAAATHACPRPFSPPANSRNIGGVWLAVGPNDRDVGSVLVTAPIRGPSRSSLSNTLRSLGRGLRRLGPCTLRHFRANRPSSKSDCTRARVDKAALALHPAPPAAHRSRCARYDVGIPRDVIDAVLRGPPCLQRRWAWLTQCRPPPALDQPHTVLPPRYQPTVDGGVVVPATFGAACIETEAKDVICAGCGGLCEPEWFREACGRFSA